MVNNILGLNKMKESSLINETFNLAYKNHEKNFFKKAENLYKKILNIDSNHFESIFLLGTLYAQTKKFNEALQFLSKAKNIQPNNADVHNNLGGVLKELENYEKAISCYEKVIKINPSFVQAYNNLGILFIQLNQFEKAINFSQKAIQINPKYAEPYNNLGLIFVHKGQHNKAITFYEKAIQINPKYADAFNNMGLAHRELKEYNKEIDSYNKAIEIQSNHVNAHYNLGVANQSLGNFQKAIYAYKKAAEFEPENLIHYYHLVALDNEMLDLNLKDKVIEIMHRKVCSKSSLAYGNFLISKYELNSKNYEKELIFLKKGQQLFFESKKEKFDLGIKYCFDDVFRILGGINTENLAKKNESKIKPIFIVGIPRCGSTLVEKIVGSGDKFVPMGEETDILENFINSKISEKQSLNLGDVGDIRNQLSNIYKKKGLILEKYNNTFTDKSLNNFFYLELIKEIYPNIKVINCRRNVLASIISIFQNNLRNIAWAHDLDNIFRYFDNYLKIIANFEEKNPNFIYNLEFDELTNKPEEESKKLMEYCELPWDKKCLEFYKRKDFTSKTASNIQIRQAIYKHSLDKYLPYKKFLNKYAETYSWFK